MTWYANSQSNTCFYVDLDNTLVYSVIHESFLRDVTEEELKTKKRSDLFKEKGFSLVFSDGEHEYFSKLRPGAKELLSALSLQGKVFLCTTATSDYADATLSFFGLDGYFSGKYYRNEIYDTVNKENCARFFLIDDLPFRSSGISQKMSFLGMNRDLVGYDYDTAEANKYMAAHIKVDPYFGKDGDAGLINILPKIQSL